jgi:hypothetical protein
MMGKDLLLRIIQESPDLPTFHIAKLAYLFDLLCVHALGSMQSDIEYRWWNFGPYSPDLERKLWDLEREGKIRTFSYKTSKNRDCRLHSPIEATKPRFSPDQETVLDYVIRRFSGMKTEELKELVYATPPMLEAQKADARMDLLHMDSRENLPEILQDASTTRMAIASHRPGARWIPAAEVMEKLMRLPE